MPEVYRLVFTRSARQELDTLPKEVARRIANRILGLRAQPRPPGCQKLRGTDGFRLRQGDYRVLYTINDSERLIDIYKIGHRREVYR